MKICFHILLFICALMTSCQKEEMSSIKGSSIRLNKSDSLVMVKLHEAMGGFGWDLQDCNTWNYVTFEYDPELEESFVVAFEGGVGFMKEKGYIPKEIGKLSRLRVFFVQDNNKRLLQGELPMEIFNCPLEIFKLEADVSGKLTPDVGKIAKTIRYFYIQGTKLSGQLPREFGQFKKLTFPLTLGNNLFSGFLPKEFSSIKGGVVLVENYLSTIEWEFFDTPRSEAYEVHMWDNTLSGTIPDSVFDTEYWKMFGHNFNSQRHGYGFTNFRF